MYERIVLALCISPIQIADLSLANQFVVDWDGSLHAAAHGAHLNIFHWTLHVVLLRRFVDGIYVIIYFSDAFEKLVIVSWIDILFVWRALSVIWVLSLGSVGFLLIMTQVAWNLHARLLLATIRLRWSPKGTSWKRGTLLTLLDAAEEGMSTAHHALFLVLSIFETNITFIAACWHLGSSWDHSALWWWTQSVRMLLFLISGHVLHVFPLSEILTVYDLIRRILLLERLLWTLNYRVLHGLVHPLNPLCPSKWSRTLKFRVLMLYSAIL